MSNGRRLAAWAMVVWLVWGSPAWAQEPIRQDPISQEPVSQDPIHKAGRGATNVVTSWIEIPKNCVLGFQEQNPILGAAWGLVKGVGLTATRVVVGVYEVVTFPLPYPPAYASPYDSLELPDYPWE